MKKVITGISLLIAICGWSQSENVHEIKIDALEALITPAIEFTYEYAISDTSGAGLATYFRFSKPNDEYTNFAISPYYRQYFYDNKAYGQKGFYVEALLQYSQGKGEAEFNETTKTETVNDFSDLGIGFGGGVKLLSNNGFSVDLGVGLGRNFKINDNSPDFFYRWGIHLGYRIF